MISHHRSQSVFCSLVVLTILGLFSSCKTETPTTTPGATSDPRTDLIQSLKGARIEGYNFETREDDNEAVASLTKSALDGVIMLDSGANNLVLRYARIKDKKANTTRTFKTEITKAGTTLTLLVTDVATGEVVSKNAFPAAEAHTGAPTFDTLQACIADFNCKNRGALECEANRTCQDQFAALLCCLKDGQCFSVHIIIRPTSLRCQLRAVIPNLDGLVFKQ